MILTDNETRVDMLNNRAIANTIVKLINESANHPICFFLPTSFTFYAVISPAHLTHRPKNSK